MSRAKLAVAISFLFAFAAGVSVGLAVRSWTHQLPGRPSLSDELSLTADQEEQVRAIWSAIVHTPKEVRREQQSEVERERNERIRELLTDDQKMGFDEIIEEFDRRAEERRLARETQIQDAVEATKRILSERQREKYEKLLAERRERGSWARRSYGWGKSENDGASPAPGD